MAAQDTLSDTEKVLVQLHSTEYQAIVTRISRFISLQFVVGPVLVAFLTLVATGYQHEIEIFSPFVVAWGCALATQLAVQTYYFALYEVYNHVRYVENDLRPKVERLLGTDLFWGYERYLTRTGKAYNPLIGDVGPAIFSLAAFALPALWRWDNCSGWDVLGLAVDGIFLILISVTVCNVVKVRVDFQKRHNAVPLGASSSCFEEK
jgi:hypothetical protein